MTLITAPDFYFTIDLAQVICACISIGFLMMQLTCHATVQMPLVLAVDGFLFLLIGTGLYNQLIHLEYCVPCVKVKSEEMRDVPNVSDNHNNIQEADYISEDEEDNEKTGLLRGKKGRK